MKPSSKLSALDVITYIVKQKQKIEIYKTLLRYLDNFINTDINPPVINCSDEYYFGPVPVKVIEEVYKDLDMICKKIEKDITQFVKNIIFTEINPEKLK